MNQVLVCGCIVEFIPGSGWRFDGFDGRVRVDPPDRGLCVDNKPVVVDEDLLGLASVLIGIGYKASGFEHMAGAVNKAGLVIDESTLSQSLTCDGKRIVHRGTKGTFEVSCRPSLSNTMPPLRDPNAASHAGTWRVIQASQESLKTD